MFSNSKNIESIGKLLLEFKKYLELQKEFVKLDATEKMTVILSAILIVTVLLLLGSIVLLFLTFALAYYLGDVLGSLSLGFGLISAFILLLTVIFYLNRNRMVIQPCLLQLHVAKEETKFGFTPDECRTLIADEEWKKLAHVQICGLMCMASNTDDMAQVRSEFHLAYELFKELKTGAFANAPYFKECSWGMSHDYPIAIEEGSTLIRVGSKIFGERVY